MKDIEAKKDFTILPMILLFPLIINVGHEPDSVVTRIVFFGIFLTGLINVICWFVCKKYSMNQVQYLALNAISLLIPIVISVYYCIEFSIEAFGEIAVYVVVALWIFLLLAFMYVVKKRTKSSGGKIVPLMASVGAVIMGRMVIASEKGVLTFFIAINFLMAFAILGTFFLFLSLIIDNVREGY